MTDDTSKVDRLDNTLYSRTRYKDPLNHIRPTREADALEQGSVAEGWQGPKLDDILTRERSVGGGMSFIKKFFAFAVLFFAATVAIAGFVFFGGTNFISSKNVDLEVTGPTTSPAGDMVELQVTIENGNNADLETANFSVQYPSGARDALDSTKQLTFAKEDLGGIKAGQSVVRNVKFSLVGQTGETKELKFSIEYKVAGSNATFYKDKVYAITIGSSPLSVTVELPSAVASGDPFTLDVTVGLNSTEVLKNVMLRAEYPYGYSTNTAVPMAYADNNVWSLGDLSPGVMKKIQIKGQLTGEDKDERTFRFYAGVAEGETPSANFKTVIFSTQGTIAVERPSVALSVKLNGDASSTYTAPAGQTLNATIAFANNLSEQLLNPRIEATLSGSALNLESVNATGSGFYDSATGKIVWGAGQGIDDLLPGNGQTLSFRFASLGELTALQASRGITLAVTITGTPIGSKTPVSVTQTRMVKIASQVALTSKVLHSTGPFVNTGQTPPKVQTTTSYAVIWSVGNTQSDVTNAKVTAKLGPGVKWLGAKSVKTEDIAYDEKTNTVTWNLGTVTSGTGFSDEMREAAFQVAITPVASQVGTAPTLVSGITFTAQDIFSKTLTLTNGALTTVMPSDPAFVRGDDIVTK